MDYNNFGPYDMLCLDGPSTSLISEMIINLGGQEVERIYEHDQIFKFVSDMSCITNEQKALKWNEGYLVDTTHLQQYIVSNAQQNYPLMTKGASNPDSYTSGISNTGIWSHLKMGPQIVTNPHPFTQHQNSRYAQLQYNVQTRSDQYLTFYNQYTWNTTTQSSYDINYEIDIGSTLTGNMITNPQFGQILSVRDNIWGIQDCRQSGEFIPFDAANPNAEGTTTCEIGYQRPHSYYFPQDKYFYFVNGGVDTKTHGSYEPYTISNTVPGVINNFNGDQVNWQYDNITKRRNTKKLFHIPLMSSIIGQMLPEQEHRLLPGKFLKQIFFEVRLNRHAFFTSGYKNGGMLNGQIDDSPYQATRADLAPVQTMLPRNWKIKKFDFIMQLYQFPTDIENQLLQQYQGGIKLHSHFYYLAHRQQFQNSSLLETNIFLNQKHKSVKSIWWWCHPNDYLNISACRKSFRISGNITKYQGEFGNVFWPFHQVQGHTSSYVMSDNQNENNDYFLEQLYHAIGHTADKNLKCPYNHINFGVNDRCYDPTLFLKNAPNLTNKEAAQITRGMSVYNEWRQGIGGGVYCINFEAIPQTGYGSLDLSASTEPFTLRLEVDKVNYFNRELTMMVWMHLDVEYIIKPDGTIDIMK